MIALLDAMIFLIILAMVSASLFSYTSLYSEESEPMAKNICDDFFATEHHANDVYGTDDTELYPIAVLIAANMNTEREDAVRSYVTEMMNGLIPEVYGYEMELEFNGKTVFLQRESTREITSEYSGTIEIPHTQGLKVRLTVH